MAKNVGPTVDPQAKQLAMQLVIRATRRLSEPARGEALQALAAIVLERLPAKGRA